MTDRVTKSFTASAQSSDIFYPRANQPFGISVSGTFVGTLGLYKQYPKSGFVGTAHYGVVSAVVTAGGSGYTAADVLTVTGSGGATITVSTVSSGAVATIAITTPGDVTALLTNPVAVTGGTGTGATFTVKYKVVSIAVVSGGSGYSTNNQLSFTGLSNSGGVTPLAHVGAVDGYGAVTAVTVDNAGTAITTAATSLDIDEWRLVSQWTGPVENSFTEAENGTWFKLMTSAWTSGTIYGRLGQNA